MYIFDKKLKSRHFISINAQVRGLLSLLSLYRGTSSTNKLAPFRECYSQLHELRSLAPAINIMALTATATKNTIDTILDVLAMKNPCFVSESPEKQNMVYVVECISKDSNIEHYFAWLADDIVKHGTMTERTIIYCQTIKQCGKIYNCIKSMIGNNLYIGQPGDARNVVWKCYIRVHQLLTKNQSFHLLLMHMGVYVSWSPQLLLGWESIVKVFDMQFILARPKTLKHQYAMACQVHHM